MFIRKKFRNCIQFATSRLDDSNGSEDRIFERIRNFLLLTEDQYSGKFHKVNTFLRLLSIDYQTKLI